MFILQIGRIKVLEDSVKFGYWIYTELLRNKMNYFHEVHEFVI